MDNLVHVCDGNIKTKIRFFRRILKAEPYIPRDMSRKASDFILKLLTKDPRKRLGGGKGDAEELKRHPFFKVSFFPITCLLSFKTVFEPCLIVICAKKIEINVNILTIVFFKDVIN
jgi:serine/threonine protein kinase